jgi:endo-1,4-beta-mannosidase
LVPSLFFNFTMFAAIFGEHYSDMIDPASQTYRAMHDYLREVVLRYRDDPTVLAWEIGNEMYLMADLECTGHDLT